MGINSNYCVFCIVFSMAGLSACGTMPVPVQLVTVDKVSATYVSDDEELPELDEGTSAEEKFDTADDQSNKINSTTTKPNSDQVIVKPSQSEDVDKKIVKKYKPPSELSINENIINGIKFLREGDVERSSSSLLAVKRKAPKNKIANDLLTQIYTDADEYFKTKESIQYELRPGETLSTIAEKFLNDSLKFHILAKYNNIMDPSQIFPGMLIHIPKKIVEPQKKPKPAVVDKATLSLQLAKKYFDSGKYQNAIDVLDKFPQNGKSNLKVRDMLVLTYTTYAAQLEEKANLLEAQTILEKALNMQPDNKKLSKQLLEVKKKRKANRLYQQGLNAFNSGEENTAFVSFSKVLTLNSKHKFARKYIVKLKADVIETYHKEAMSHYRRQELKSAIKKWDQLLKYDPNHEMANLYRARAINLKKRIDDL